MLQKILVTGGAGYVGSILVPKLLESQYSVRVLDRFFFGAETLNASLSHPQITICKGDIRSIAKKELRGVDVVIHLASISNDPTCEIDQDATKSINYEGTLRLAELSKAAGVKRFIFSSSCSVYGSVDDVGLTEESHLEPVSLYATTKMMSEKAILKLSDLRFAVTILRNATIYGVSPRMRFDLVVNLMTLSAFKKRQIYILGGGRQWRPNVHVEDVADAFMTVIGASVDKVEGQIFNVGSSGQNHQIIQIAKMVKNVVADTTIEIIPSDPDKRDYNVNCDKIKKVLNYETKKNIMDGIVEIYDGLKNGIINDDLKTRTLEYYKYLIEANKILKEVSLKGKIF